MIRKSDVQWWILEVKKDPESAPEIIEQLAIRLAELDLENERLRGELIQLERGAQVSAGNAELEELQRKVDTLQTILKGQASTETSVVLFSEQMEGGRMPLSQVRLRLKEGRPALSRSAVLGVRSLLLARPQDDLLLLTSQGRFIKLFLHKIPFLVQELNLPQVEEAALEAGERVTTAVPVGKAPRFWTVVTRRGFVRQLLHLQIDRQLGTDQAVVGSSLHNDGPVALVDGDRGDLLVITRWGKAVRFSQRIIGTKGCVALDVEQDDEVVAAVPVSSDSELLILTSAGKALRRETSRFPAQSKTGGSGKPFIQAYDVLGAVPFSSRGTLLYLTYSGKYVAASISSVPLQGRAGRGSELVDLSQDPAVAFAFVPGALL